MELKQGDLENIILNALWQMEEEEKERIDVKDVQERIRNDQQSWAYTTVKTVLDRLVEKDLVLRIKDGKKYLYKSAITRDKAGEKAVKKLARQYFRNNFEELISCAERVNSLDDETSQEKPELITV